MRLFIFLYFLVASHYFPHIAWQRKPWNPMLRDSVHIKALLFSTYHQILEALCVVQRNPTPCFALTPEQRNRNIKYFISSCESGNRIHNLSRSQSHSCAPAPLLAYFFYFLRKILKYLDNLLIFRQKIKYMLSTLYIYN